MFKIFIKIISVLLVLTILILILLLFTPYNDITYFDDKKHDSIIIQINKNTKFELQYLYSSNEAAMDYQINSLSGVLLSTFTMYRVGDSSMKLNKCTIRLYDMNNNTIAFKRIQWDKGNSSSDESFIHYANERDLLKEYKKVGLDYISYVYEELDDDFEKVRIDYHFIFTIDGKTYEIKDSKDLYRKSEWKIHSSAIY